VVTAANFLIDAESQVQGAVATWESQEAGTIPIRSAAGEAQSTLAVEILEPRQATIGRTTLRFRILDSRRMPVENAQVDVNLYMPAMGTMAPMAVAATLRPEGRGIYTGTIDIPSAFSWQTTVTVRRDGRVIGTVRTTILAR
jgi:hypothetical protein